MTTASPRPLTVCRACRLERLTLFLPLGDHPPANRFLPESALQAREAKFPLDAYACLACGLIQVADYIPPDFFRHYVYVPSASRTMHHHFADLARRVAEGPIGPRDGLIVDIGSNDGLFLSYCRDRGLRTLGVEPAENLAAVARGKGVEVVNEYFTPALAKEIRASAGPAGLVVTTNTFNHIDDLHGFVEGVRVLLAEDGVFIIEVPQATDLIGRNEFDTIYHEHLSEFSVKSLTDLLGFFDMELYDLERLEIHGGSMRAFAQHGGGPRAVASRVAEWRRAEEEAGLYREDTYREFTGRVHALRASLLELLHALKDAGHSLAGYGAPAKGNTLLNFCGIGPDLLLFLADRNPLKHGLYSPGMHIPVVPVERIRETPPDYLLLLAWNFADEILREQEAFTASGGRFILPIPEPRIL